MSSISPSFAPPPQYFQETRRYQALSSEVGLRAGAATFILVTALTIIIGASLCIPLKGVAMQNVFKYAIAPCCVASIMTLPLLYPLPSLLREQAAVREHLLAALNRALVDVETLESYFPGEINPIYANKLLEELKARSPANSTLIDECIQRLSERWRPNEEESS